MPASASELDNVNAKINNLSNLIQQKRNEKQTVENEIAIIDAQISKLQLQIEATQTEIANLNYDIESTTNQIAHKEEELRSERKKMQEYLATMYEEDQTSLVEQIIKANTFSDFVDRKEYLSAMQLKIKETADQIEAIKKDLEKKRASLSEKRNKAEGLQKAQIAQKNAQIGQKAYKDSLLAQIKNQESNMQSQLNDLHAKKAMLSASYGEVVARGSSFYPYGNPPARRIIDTPDPWGYLIGECTSYAAWKRMSTGRPVPRGLGNANTWGVRASGMGLSVNSNPRPGDVMVMPYFGGYGHVAYVEAVYGNGSVLISEYNWTPYSYSTRTVNPYNYGAVFIH